MMVGAIRLERVCALSVTIGPPSEEDNSRVCGTLVKMNDGNFYPLLPIMSSLTGPRVAGEARTTWRGVSS